MVNINFVSVGIRFKLLMGSPVALCVERISHIVDVSLSCSALSLICPSCFSPLYISNKAEILMMIIILIIMMILILKNKKMIDDDC